MRTSFHHQSEAQPLSDCSVDLVWEMFLAGSSLLFGIGTWALP
jgi:hypothetical protein